MSSILELLFNAASGGIVGTGMHLLTDWVDTKNKIALMKAQTESAEKVEAWKAFSASQVSNAPFTVPANSPVWASAAYTCVACCKDITRPLLTWAAVLFMIYVYITATPPTRDAMTPEIQMGAWTAVFFWFGSRYTRK